MNGINQFYLTGDSAVAFALDVFLQKHQQPHQRQHECPGERIARAGHSDALDPWCYADHS